MNQCAGFSFLVHCNTTAPCGALTLQTYVKDFALTNYLRRFFGNILVRRKFKGCGRSRLLQHLQNFVHQHVIQIILRYTLHFARIKHCLCTSGNIHCSVAHNYNVPETVKQSTTINMPIRIRNRARYSADR
jgi:hypothetical protein